MRLVRFPLTFFFILMVSGCTCKQAVSVITSALGADQLSLDFGPQKLGKTGRKTLRLEAKTKAPVLLKAIRFEGADSSEFAVVDPPSDIDALTQADLVVSVTPIRRGAMAATLLIESNDPDLPVMSIPVLAEGATGLVEVTPACEASRGCQGVAVVSPPSLDFGKEPAARLVPIEQTRLPSIEVTNAGLVELNVAKLVIDGADADSFSFVGNAALPAGGLVLSAQTGFNLPIRFTPRRQTQATYSASVLVGSDDPDHGVVRVPLTGELRANAPPSVCANLIRAVPPPNGDGPRDYSSSAEWSRLKTVPALGYDFSETRDVRPNDLVIFSALSDAADATQCTTDLEDGRTGLTFSWRLARAPNGAEHMPISGAATSQVQMRPIIMGEYFLELAVKDFQGHETLVPIRFSVSFKQDLVVQLQWPGGNQIDLDVHLVRPSSRGDGGESFEGVFSPFEERDGGRPTGDINGYSLLAKGAQHFEWGDEGTLDDPRLNLDDTGSGALLENVGLSFPEHDAPCATASCRYGVFVHYFRDARPAASSAGCVVGAGCGDGDACSCIGSGERCVSDSAPVNDAGVGAGKCFVAPTPTVRLFFRGRPTPSKVIPLEGLAPPDVVRIGAPCQMLHVADVEWPAKSAIGTLADGGTPPPLVHVIGVDGAGRMTKPSIARFGWRQAGGDLQCIPDGTSGRTPWYSRQP
jgi:hypothetical protein